MPHAHWFFSPLCALLLAPLLMGIINRTKAIVAGRRGPPLLQPYRDVAKCLRRGAVYGEVTSWLFRLGPVVNLATLGRESPDPAVWRRRGGGEFPGRPDRARRAPRARPVRHRARRARYRVELRRHGGEPRGSLRRLGRTGAPGRAGDSRAGDRRAFAERHLRRDHPRRLGSRPPGAGSRRDDARRPRHSSKTPGSRSTIRRRISS